MDLSDDDNDTGNDEPVASSTAGVRRTHAQVEGDNGGVEEARHEKRQRLEALANERRNRVQGQAPHNMQPCQTNPAQGPDNANVPKIPKPKGQAGKDFSLAVKMGLAKGNGGRLRYNALLRSAREVVSEAHLDWQKPWADIPPADKAMAFSVLRERDPFLKRFENDWASEAMIRQYLKNKRKTNYLQGTLEVPSKYAYLKENSAKRDQSKSRKRKAIEESRERKRRAKEAKRAKKAKASQRRRLYRAVELEDEDEETEFIQGSSRDGAGQDESHDSDHGEDGGKNDDTIDG
ncbi:hypothetical protein K435DRAFT_800029 [Dendrothele bispora CBS 962.96]|uniref:Uncharacterized protein n=1 Tax=Dendrothele bispora (strain CBS 962.96) TaxID=1314807 RepID=A0A4S8LU21_DENBC|nr:hypothetical protein K435DRAFT_800029 [Dendrothele bispora CBS 962.96]